MKRIQTLAALAALSFLLASPAGAVSIEPGQWEMTISMTMPMLPQPQVRTYSECIEETEFEPEDFQMDENDQCEIADVSEEGNSLSWSIVCETPQGPMTGQWGFTSGGDSLEGEGSMSMSIQGQEMTLTTAWSGTRTGDCAAE